MSAFLVEDKTINKVVCTIARMIKNHDLYNAKNDLKILGYDFENDIEASQKLGNDLYTMNCEAVTSRYTGDILSMWRDKDNLAYQYDNGMGTVAIEAFKALQCLLYQCTEGNIPESKLYKTMRKIEGDLAISIVRDMPEYDVADWG